MVYRVSLRVTSTGIAIDFEPWNDLGGVLQFLRAGVRSAEFGEHPAGKKHGPVERAMLLASDRNTHAADAATLRVRH